jgi:hypothetical protein
LKLCLALFFTLTHNFGLIVETAQANVSRQDPEVAAIPLYTSRDYNPEDEQSRGFRSFFTGIGVSLFGRNQDMSKEILKKLDQEDLRIYFPKASERQRLADRISSEMHSRYLNRGFNNQNLVLALKYATTEMITAVTKRVLETEGMKDPSRAALWSNKILASFKACADRSRTHKEVGKCGEALEADLVKNLGLAKNSVRPIHVVGLKNSATACRKMAEARQR